MVSQIQLRKLANKVLKHEGLDGVEISVLLVDDAQIRKLNRKYLGKNRFTDVLAFRMGDGEFRQLNSQVLGDVVISVERAKKCSSIFETTYEKELSLYLIHGILHLIGYIDTTKRGFAKMKKNQEEILEKSA
ncbi:MAG: rRNA maturation RNase YbeY [Candidatus Omnitrophota bacterium]